MDHIVTRTCLTSLAIVCLVSCIHAPASRPAPATASHARELRPDDEGVVQTTGLVIVLGSAGLISISIPAAIAMNDVSDPQAMGAVIGMNAALGTLGIIGLVLATWDDDATRKNEPEEKKAKVARAALSPAAQTAGGHAAAALHAAPSSSPDDMIEP